MDNGVLEEEFRQFRGDVEAVTGKVTDEDFNQLVKDLCVARESGQESIENTLRNFVIAQVNKWN